MPQTKIELDQTIHIGSSGTLVSDEELTDASGVLQQQLNFNSNPLNVVSGIASLLRFDLPLNADDDDVNHTFVNNLPVAEFDSDQRSSWNLKTPVGGISGIEFDFSWFPENDEIANTYSFDLEIRELPVGADTSAIVPITVTATETLTALQDILANTNVKANIDIPGLQDISINLVRNSDSFDGKIRVVSYGLIYKASGVE